jgi:hypothetical protein
MQTTEAERTWFTKAIKIWVPEFAHADISETFGIASSSYTFLLQFARISKFFFRRFCSDFCRVVRQWITYNQANMLKIWNSGAICLVLICSHGVACLHFFSAKMQFTWYIYSCPLLILVLLAKWLLRKTWDVNSSSYE